MRAQTNPSCTGASPLRQLFWATLPLWLYGAVDALPTDDFIRYVFVAPAARLASLMLGTPLQEIPQGLLFEYQGISVCVTTACSGFGFFCILWCMLNWLHLRRNDYFPAWLGKTPFGWLWLPLLAYPLAVFANACRLGAGVLAHAFSHPRFDGRYDALAHEAAGVLVFLFFLTAVVFLLQFARHAKPSPAA